MATRHIAQEIRTVHLAYADIVRSGLFTSHAKIVLKERCCREVNRLLYRYLHPSKAFERDREINERIYAEWGDDFCYDVVVRPLPYNIPVQFL